MARKPPQLSLTAELISLVDRREPDSGPEFGLIELLDEEYELAARQILLQNAGNPFWVFAYGSLIWKPDFEHVEHRACKAFGWRRSFCLDIVRWRATPQQPGLMICMDDGGAAMALRSASRTATTMRKCCACCVVRPATKRTFLHSAGSTCMTGSKNSVH